MGELDIGTGARLSKSSRYRLSPTGGNFLVSHGFADGGLGGCSIGGGRGGCSNGGGRDGCSNGGGRGGCSIGGGRGGGRLNDSCTPDDCIIRLNCAVASSTVGGDVGEIGDVCDGVVFDAGRAFGIAGSLPISVGGTGNGGRGTGGGDEGRDMRIMTIDRASLSAGTSSFIVKRIL